jgi:hypothetical protein
VEPGADPAKAPVPIILDKIRRCKDYLGRETKLNEAFW